MPDLSFISSAAWSQDQSLQAAREQLLEGLLDEDDHQQLSNGYATSGARSSRSATPPTAFREPEDDEYAEPEPVAGPSSISSMTAVDSLFAKLVGPSNVSTPTSLPSGFDSPGQSHAHAPARAHPGAPSRDKERKGRELLDQLFATAVPAPTPPPPAPERVSRMRSPQAPQPQVLNPDVLQMLLGFRSTPRAESSGDEQQRYLSVDEQDPEGARTPVVIHQPIPQRMSVQPDPHADGGMDREAVVDAAADLLSRRGDPVLRAAQDAGVLDKNAFGRRLVELIHVRVIPCLDYAELTSCADRQAVHGRSAPGVPAPRLKLSLTTVHPQRPFPSQSFCFPRTLSRSFLFSLSPSLPR